MVNALTVDVEDYFHPTEIQGAIAPEEWPRLPSRVGDATRRVLELLAERGARGTFFVLGWVAEREPALVRAIHAAGHEVGCHSYAHQLTYRLTPAEFRADTQRAQAAIGDACGVPPRSYRAPSYSITQESLWALEILAELGFRRDSSIYPIRHDRYGIPGFGRHAQTVATPAGPILEIPPATVELAGGHVAPIGGGGYLRLLPYRYTAAGIRRVNGGEGQPACVYFHPWEIDTGQPRLAASRLAALRTYLGLRGMERKLRRLLREFSFATLETVYPVAA